MKYTRYRNVKRARKTRRKQRGGNKTRHLQGAGLFDMCTGASCISVEPPVSENTVYYYNPDIPIIDGKFTGQRVRRTELNEGKMTDSLYEHIVKMNTNNDEVMAGTHPENYMWSLYTQFDPPIPPYSYFFEENAYVKLSKVFENLVRWKNTNILNTYFNLPLGTDYIDISLEQRVNVFIDNVINLNKYYYSLTSKYDYKIHLCVKEEYIVYTVFKALKVLYEAFPRRHFNCKFTLEIRSSHLTSKDTGLLSDKVNSGPLANIFIYPTSRDPAFVRSVLNTLLKVFPEESQIGSMELTGSLTIPFGNIRLSHMLCYAQGDRGQKLDTKILNKQNNAAVSTKVIPTWLTAMKEKCPNDIVNKNSQLFFGIPFCDSDAKYDEKCVDAICYMAMDDTMLDPHTIDSPYISKDSINLVV